MKRDDKKIKIYAEKTLAEIYDSQDADWILRELQAKDSEFRNLKPELFKTEYTCAQIAFNCFLWQKTALEVGLVEDSVAKALIRTVTRSFESPKSMEIAIRFSEYFHAVDMENEDAPSIAVAKRLFSRLPLKHKAAEDFWPSLKLLIEILESYRVRFENDFLKYIEAPAKPPGGSANHLGGD